MKKLFTLFMMVSYMASAIGLTFSLHYCGGSYKEICFTSDTEKNCCGTKEKSRGCCEDKVIKAKIKDDHSSSSKAFFSKIVFEQAVVLWQVYFGEHSNYNGNYVFIANDSSPPLVPPLPIYLLNRVLRI